MAQTKRKRKRKHRGTQGGSIDKSPQRRPRNREEAKAQARRRSAQPRQQGPPTWQSAATRGLIGAVIFFVVMTLAFGRPPGASAAVSVVMLAFYIPLGYYVDRFFYRRRRAKELRARAQQKQQRGR